MMLCLNGPAQSICMFLLVQHQETKCKHDFTKRKEQEASLCYLQLFLKCEEVKKFDDMRTETQQKVAQAHILGLLAQGCD